MLVSCKRAKTEKIARETYNREKKKLTTLAHVIPKDHVRQGLWIWLDNKGWYAREIIE